MSDKAIEYDIKANDKTGRGITSALGRLRGFVKGVFENLANIKAGLDMAVGAVRRFASLFVQSIREAFRFEKAIADFRVLLGSIDKAKKHIAELRDYANTTPFGFQDLAAASRMLMSFGTKVEDIMPSLKMLGDIAMGDKQKFQGLALVFGQIRSAGRLMGQDLLQLINQGFNPLTIISQKTGKTMVELKKMMENGAISFEMVSEAMRIATSEGGLFANSMGEAAKTGQGLMSTLEDEWTESLRTFGEEFTQLAKGGIQWCINKLQELRESGAIKEWADKAKTAIYAVMGAFKGLGDKSTRSAYMEALKDVTVGLFEKAAHGAVSILVKSARVIGELIADGFKNPLDERAAKKVAHRDLLEQWNRDGKWSRLGFFKNGGTKEDFDAAVAVKTEEILDEMRRNNAAEAQMLLDRVAPMDGEESRFSRGLRALKELGEKAAKEMTEIAGAESGTPSNAGEKDNAPRKTLQQMMDEGNVAAKEKAERERQRALEAEEKERVRIENAVARERERLRKQELREHRHELEEVYKAAQDAHAEAMDWVSAAKDRASTAWDFYKNRDALTDHIAGMDQEFAARDQYAKDYHSLTHGVHSGKYSHLKSLARHKGQDAVEEQLHEWRRKKLINVDTEATMRVAVANEEQRWAAQYARETAEDSRRSAEALEAIRDIICAEE